MSKQSQDNDSLSPAPAEQDMVALIKSVQQQLVLLERKIDTLIRQSETRPVREKHFSKPFQSQGRRHHPSDRGQEGSSGERKFYSGKHSDRGRSEESHESGHRKKTYGSSQRSALGQERYLKSHLGDKTTAFGKKNKMFEYKRKKRG